MATIESFRGQYRFLSNFYECLVVYDGETYPSSEHAFQSAKSKEEKYKRYIRSMQTPGLAKKAGRTARLRKDWEDIKDDVMLTVLRSKFRSRVLRSKLLLTGRAKLVEGNTWGDTYWGVCNGEGQNKLGKLLMKVRSELADS